jgi:hypothetical protein
MTHAFNHPLGYVKAKNPQTLHVSTHKICQDDYELWNTIEEKTTKLILRHCPVILLNILKPDTCLQSPRFKPGTFWIWVGYVTALCWGTVLVLDRMRKIPKNLKLYRLRRQVFQDQLKCLMPEMVMLLTESDRDEFLLSSAASILYVISVFLHFRCCCDRFWQLALCGLRAMVVASPVICTLVVLEVVQGQTRTCVARTSDSECRRWCSGLQCRADFYLLTYPHVVKTQKTGTGNSTLWKSQIS